eukprot:CAMPEP_0206247864 /NCGR_PEP_ID=MMETSP0047_2-20121206/20046_1 /ASSEMBLY_ACC=CAM_ASM_000192 /TAXON_ID=195065 /ORGANISM="Chroomonas mesostigmatica_cf, Strain CCMP1168" /LENGTH=137 /DNA_ID=CAMNT_0053673435 /DNA_START=15 /DNA_END=428 /DNA_ORIENTATION=+
MVKVYGSATVSAPERETVNVNRQLLAAVGIIGLALVVCCALVAQADFKGQAVVMYGLGSGEEEAASQGTAVTFETFKDNAEMVEKELGEEYYKTVFKELEEAEEQKKHEEEVDFAIKEAIAEHAILAEFAAGVAAKR